MPYSLSEMSHFFWFNTDTYCEQENQDKRASFYSM